MNSREMMASLDKARAFYPAFFEKKTDEALLEIAEAWAELFAGVDTGIFAEAFQAAILSSKFFPTPAEIREKLIAMTKRDEMTEQEAWGLVRAAMKTGRSNTLGAWDSLPECVRRAIGSAEILRDWATMDTNTVNSVIASNFMRSYRTVAEQQTTTVLPASAVQEAFALPIVDRSEDDYKRLEELGAHGLIRFQKMYSSGLRGKEIQEEVRRAADDDLFRLEFGNKEKSELIGAGA